MQTIISPHGARGIICRTLHRFLDAIKLQFMLFTLQATPFVVIAQQNDFLYSVAFVKTETTSYSIVDTAYLFDDRDFVKLQSQTMKDSVVRTVNMNYMITSTIFHLENSTLEDWMNSPAKTVVNSRETVSYDVQGNELTRLDHSEALLQSYAELRQTMSRDRVNLIPRFPYVNQRLINQFLRGGFTYSERHEAGSFFILDTIEICINNHELTQSLTIYKNDGTVDFYSKQGFRENELGQIVPLYSITKTWDDRFSDQCVRKTVLTHYENYRVNYPGGRSENETAGDDGILIFPNPASDVVNIVFGKNECASCSIEILDGTGAVVLSTKSQALAEDMVIPVAKLSAGLYFIRIYNDEKEFHTSFYKN